MRHRAGDLDLIGSRVSGGCRNASSVKAKIHTSKLCHHSSAELSATEAGLEMNPALRTKMSQVPTVAATSFNAFSSVTLTAWTEQLAVPDGSFSFVSVRVVSLRPRRISCFAPALAKAMAVSRPIPLPFEKVSD